MHARGLSAHGGPTRPEPAKGSNKRRLRLPTLLTLCISTTLAATPLVQVVAESVASADAPVSFLPGTPNVDQIVSPAGTSGSSAAPWNTSQGDPGQGSPYTANGVGTLYPTYTPGGNTTTVGGVTEPNLAVYPGSGSVTDGTSGNTPPYPSGTVGTPGPLDGYCNSGGNTAATTSPTTVNRQTPGTTLPFSPYYFPQVVETPGDNSAQDLTGYFDYRPKDDDEALVAATSTDGGNTWTYDSEALEENPGYCPNVDINDDGEGHSNVLTIGGTSRLYTLQRPAGDNQGVGMLVHGLTGVTASNPLGNLPATERVGVDPDDFASISGSPISVPTTGAAPAIGLTMDLSNASSGPEQLVSGEFVDLTADPTPNASQVMTCTVSGASLTGCTAASTGTGVTVSNGDLIEQVIATISSGLAGAAATSKAAATSSCTSPSTTPVVPGKGNLPCTVPVGPNTVVGDGGLAGFGITDANSDNLTMSIFNANAPNRAYVDGVPVYCSQSNASPTTKIENCTTGPGGSGTLLASVGDPVTSDPIIPPSTTGSTVSQTSGLVSPDGIVGTLPAYPNDGSVPGNASYVMYTEKILNYYIAGVMTAKSAAFSTIAGSLGGVINFIPSPTTSLVLPASGSFTVEMGDLTEASLSTPVDTVVPVTCTGWNTSGAPTSGVPTDNLTGCAAPATGAIPNYSSSDTFDKSTWLGTPNAALVSGNTLALTGEGSATNAQKLFKNNEDYTALRVAWSTDGVNFSSAGLTNGGIISGNNSGGASYNDISNPAQTTSPSNLNAYATPGTPDATEMRWVGSAGTIVPNIDGSGAMGLFLSGAWAADGDSDAFNQIFYTSSTDGEHWTVPVSVVSTDYTFSASENQITNPTQALGVSAYYSGRAYGPSVIDNNGNLTMVFAGYRLPKPIVNAGTKLGTGTTQYTVGTTDPALYRNILTVALTSEGGCTPSCAAPEVPLAVAVPLLGVAVMGGATALAYRRRRHPAEV